ncbi:MAG: hypothetical protein WCA20_10050 [Candidatus Sulfotelmatobacter sp.]
MSVDTLLVTLAEIRANASGRAFILADARDADMAWGIPSFGKARTGQGFRSAPAFLEEIRAVVRQGIVDVLLASASTLDTLAHKERLFDGSQVTPAVRINDASDIWLQRGAHYREWSSAPFATAYIPEAQFGSLTAPRESKPVVNLGLYSMTFNNDLEADLRTLRAFREFRAEAEKCGFHYFLEVFAPNSPRTGLTSEQVPAFVNDQIVRTLAGVPSSGRPLFLKIPYFGPGPLEELVAYDPSVIVGILGGSSGTTYDAFRLLAEARKYGARVALFGRRIKDSEHPLAFIRMLRLIADCEIEPEEAVRTYHSELEKQGIRPKYRLEEDLLLTTPETS